MENFKTALNIVSKQNNFGFGVVALLTAGGEQIFSSVAFQCPCNELNFLYGMVFLLVPALALLLLGYILSKRLWKLLTGVCQHRACHQKNLLSAITAFFQISTTAMVAPSSWIAVALLSGNYYECAMTGTNVSAYNQHLCQDTNANMLCEKVLHQLPCGGDSQVPQNVRQEVLSTLRAQSQILGWLLIASIMLSNLLLICVARCTSPISYLQLKFWRTYAHEESDLINMYSTKHAKELAERNLRSFFSLTPPEDFTTPSNTDWQKISALYKFSTRDHYYSSLQRYVENRSETDAGFRMTSVCSSTAANNPAVLDFVDDGPI